MDANPDHTAAVESLLRLINPEPADADAQIADFHAQLVDPDRDDEDEEQGLIWVVKDVIDWSSGFFVDWKDTESLVGAIDAISEPWGATVDWGASTDDEFASLFDDSDVPTLIRLAHAQLAARGLTLWTWETQGDCYAGWIARSANDADIRAIAARLDVGVKPGNATDGWMQPL